ncbi:NUDIX domain-containing protein [Actinomadura madurae]|uniref:NUDIX domain-containing protein n=1 Tax=Actinomadura madurae TaxID=1993 RepID=UPI0020272EFC|nr:NUDIX hydrolase [Actinomadura madurae]MCQ0004119.1 NUDIX hydrolase [Actinomadura madurae]URN00566.1 NUDIX hydrolase [Actinomadura madurae]URN02721.1 NUDIX hydrolase [Actinomadura madurae]
MSGEELGPGDVRDRPERWTVVESSTPYKGRVFGVRVDQVEMPVGDGVEAVQRDVIEHIGSVGVIAVDDRDRVLLLRQYRHPVARLLWEAPAGLRDVDGEPLHKLAERELLEESGYRAERWDTLLDVYPTPGMADERVRIFLARGLTEVPADEIDFERVHEEADMPVVWVPLEEAVRKVFAGELHNMIACMGVLAVRAARDSGYADLRPVDAPEH